MCLAIPSRVESLDGLSAVVEAGGRRRTVNLMLLDEQVAVGDYLLIQHGQFAYERIDAERAQQTLALIDEITAAGRDGADLRAWG